MLAFALNSAARVQFRGRQVQTREVIVQEDSCGLDFSFMNEIDIVTIAVSARRPCGKSRFQRKAGQAF